MPRVKEILGFLSEAKKLKVGDKPFSDKNWVITKYSPLEYDDAGSPSQGNMKIVNQKQQRTKINLQL